MNNFIFLAVLILSLACLLVWGFRHLPDEQWQVFAVIPDRKMKPGTWNGLNLTFYGIFNALAYTIATGILILLLSSTGIPVHQIMALIGLISLLCLPAAKIGGRTGINAFLSFLLVTMVLWKLYFPMLLKGYHPIWTGLAIVTILTGFITFSVGGLNRRELSAFVGSLSGISLTCVLAVISTRAFHLHGAVQPFSETLLYAGYYGLDLTKIFISTIFIASSGAVMNLAMDIAASMEEIKYNHPEISFLAHLSSGLRVARAALGTMATTLLLAYSISHSTMFMFFMAKGLPLENVLNAPFITAELLNILIGSFGLITVAPLTATITAMFCRIEKAGASASRMVTSLPMYLEAKIQP